MFPRLYYCREVNDLFALHSLGVTNFVRDVPSPPRSTFEGEGDGDGGGGASVLTTSVVVRAVAAAQPKWGNILLGSMILGQGGDHWNENNQISTTDNEICFCYDFLRIHVSIYFHIIFGNWSSNGLGNKFESSPGDLGTYEEAEKYFKPSVCCAVIAKRKKRNEIIVKRKIKQKQMRLLHACEFSTKNNKSWSHMERRGRRTTKYIKSTNQKSHSD